MCSELGVVLGRVGVGIPGARKYGAALNAGLETLLAEGQSLELIQAVTLGRAVYQCVFEQNLSVSCVIER